MCISSTSPDSHPSPHPLSRLHTPQLEVYKGDIQRLHRKMERLTSREGVSVASQGGADGDTHSMGEQCIEVPVPFICIHTITSSHFTHPHLLTFHTPSPHISHTITSHFTPSLYTNSLKLHTYAYSQLTLTLYMYTLTSAHPHIIHTLTSYTLSHHTHTHIIHTLTYTLSHHTHSHIIHTLTSYTPSHTLRKIPNHLD